MASYIRWEGKNRETGTRTQVVDTTHADSEFDAEPGNRWMVICMDHSMLVTSHALEVALALSAHPLQWCGRCNGTDTEGGQEAPAAEQVEVAVWGPNLGTSHGSEAMHIHSVGCADTRKGVYKGHKPWTITVSSLQEIVEDVYGDMLDESEDSDWHDYAGDIRLFPCTGIEA